MKILEDFAKNGLHYKIVLRKDNLAILKACSKESGGAVAYDVIVIRERKETKIFDNLMPATEYGPSNEEGGSFLWSYPNMEMAQGKFDELVESGRFNKGEKTS